jgi:hypothetical protein
MLNGNYLGDVMERQIIMTPSPTLLRRLAERETRCTGQCAGILSLQGELEGVIDGCHLNGILIQINNYVK